MIFAMTFEDTGNPSQNAESGEGHLRAVEGGRGMVVNRIGKSFNKRPVVRSVSLTLKRGEVVGLLGPNGAGKTTCFNMICGQIAADTGSIEVDGHDVTRLADVPPPASASAICHRRPRSSAASPPSRISVPAPN